MAEMSTLNGYEIVDEGSRTLLDSMGEPVAASENPLPMSGLMGGKYEVVDKKARDKINEILANQVQDGYTVNFFDSDNQLIQTTRTKYGYKADLPLSHVVDHWEDINGALKQFPLTFSASSGVQTLNVYESNDAMTCERVLYGHFGVKKEDYPCVLVTMDNMTGGASIIMFFTMTWFNDGSGSMILMNANWSTTRVGDLGTIAWTDNMTENVEKIIAKNVTLRGPKSDDFTIRYSPTTRWRLYANFANGHSSGRLDQNIFGAGIVLPPYSLQAKIAEQGDTVVPDDGYYGLSKVTVNPIQLQEKIVTESGEVIPDEGYHGLSKVVVDVAGGVAGPSDSYTVNFYDYDQSLLETHVVKTNNEVNCPVVYGSYPNGCWWSNTDGNTVGFPFAEAESGAVINLHRHMHEKFKELYSYFGVDMMEYPYIVMGSRPTLTVNDVLQYGFAKIWFTKDIFVNEYNSGIKECKYTGDYCIVGPPEVSTCPTNSVYTDINEVGNFLMEHGVLYEMSNSKATLPQQDYDYYFVNHNIGGLSLESDYQRC